MVESNANGRPEVSVLLPEVVASLRFHTFALTSDIEPQVPPNHSHHDTGGPR